MLHWLYPCHPCTTFHRQWETRLSHCSLPRPAPILAPNQGPPTQVTDPKSEPSPISAALRTHSLCTHRVPPGRLRSKSQILRSTNASTLGPPALAVLARSAFQRQYIPIALDWHSLPAYSGLLHVPPASSLLFCPIQQLSPSTGHTEQGCILDCAGLRPNHDSALRLPNLFLAHMPA